jgi:multiple sugar transport system permease protein
VGKAVGRLRRLAFAALVALVGLIVLYPVYQMLILSFLPKAEIADYIAAVENPANRFVPGYFVPRFFSFEQFRYALNDRFLRALFVSVFYTVVITVLHFFVSFVLGFVFAKVKFAGREFLFFLFLAAMVLPFHVTLVPLFQVINRLDLMDTPWAVVLPAVFSPLGVFLFRQYISQVSDDVLEAASIDGAGLFRILKSMVLPMVKGGAAVFFLLTVTMQWGEIERSLAFNRDADWLPLSLYLRELMTSDTARIFAPGVIYMLPVLILCYFLSRRQSMHDFGY